MSAWWIGPLLVLGRYSPPFTDFIESSYVTTRWLNLAEVLRDLGLGAKELAAAVRRPAGQAVAEGDDDVMGEPFEKRRARLEALFAQWPTSDSVYLTRTTRDADEARRWFEQFEGAGLDGVVAKRRSDVYEPGKRTMLKIKHKRTAEAVVVGYRVHKSGDGVGSLLLALADADGELHNVGGISAFTAARRRELVDELAPLVVRDADGNAAHGETDRSRFSSSKDVSFVPLRPERVVEVAFDQLEGNRFRHAVTFLRWRPDREPTSCTLEQVERAPDYDLGEVLPRG